MKGSFCFALLLLLKNEFLKQSLTFSSLHRRGAVLTVFGGKDSVRPHNRLRTARSQADACSRWLLRRLSELSQNFLIRISTIISLSIS